MTQLISDWKDLVDLESNAYYLQIDDYGYSGHIRRKSDDTVCEYLGPHSFYNDQYQFVSAILQEYGFTVQLENWDGETEWIDVTEQWKYRGKCNLCQKLKDCSQYDATICPAAKEWMQHLETMRNTKLHHKKGENI